MTARDSFSAENPFSVRKQRRRRDFAPLIRAAKYLAAVSVALAITLVVIHQNQRWLVSRLTSDFDSLAPEQKIPRLVQIAEIGPLSIPHLSRTLTDPNPSVARTANTLLHDSQESWALESADQNLRNHKSLVAALDANATSIQPNRSGWVTSLLQQTIMEATANRDKDWEQINRDAAKVIAKLSLETLAEKQTVTGAVVRQTSAKPYMNERPPLPLETWTKWPEVEANRTKQQNQNTEASDSPSRYQTSTSLKQLPRGQTVGLQPVPIQNASMRNSLANQNQMAQGSTYQIKKDNTPELVMPANHVPAEVIVAPFETLNITSVITWLADPDADMRRQAELELQRRGMQDRELRLAYSIASGDAETRLQLVDVLAQSQDIDPRFWLGMLLSDKDRSVKLAAISVLATMDDPKVRQLLQVRMQEDRDPIVIAKLRRSLGLR